MMGIVSIFWGLPSLFHPDEMNMAMAAVELATTKTVHFYAYGQFPLFVSTLFMLFTSVSAENAAQGLRLLSMVSSVSTAVFIWILLKKRNMYTAWCGVLLFLFTPLYIQGARFGTTESFLGLCMVALMTLGTHPLLAGSITGIAVSTKLSALVLLCIPAYYWFYTENKKRYLLLFLISAFPAYIVASPFNVLHFSEFLSSMRYESAVARGTAAVFYTRQFADIPFYFPLTHILPFAFGIPLMLAAVLGLNTVWKEKRHYIVWFVCITVPVYFLYTQWTRFYYLSGLFLVIFAAYGVAHFKKAGVLLIALHLFLGAFFIYNTSLTDPRTAAQQWIEKNSANGTFITEAANVYDIPMDDRPKLSLFLYDEQAPYPEGYVVVPSRRVFANYTCAFRSKFERIGIDCATREKSRPDLHRYYSDIENTCTLLHEESRLLPFEEFAEETWTVFDRPVVRIYKCPPKS